MSTFFAWLGSSLIQPGFWFQPLFYSFHGWLATEMALAMLFRPYEPKYLPGTKLRLPFTPGIFPRGRHKLSISIANTITEILLTEKDIKKQAEKLVTEENIYQALEALLDSVGKELRDVGNIRQLYKSLDRVLPNLLNKLVHDAISALEEGDDKQYQALFDQLFTHVVPHIRLEHSQATLMVDLVFNTALSPGKVRLFLVDLLTDTNNERIETLIRNQIHGLQGLLLRFLDIQKALQQLRDFLKEQPAGSEDLILELIDQLELREKTAQQLLAFSPQHLSGESLEHIKAYLSLSLKKALIQHRDELALALSNLSQEATHSLTKHLFTMDWSDGNFPGFKRDAARFIHTYLNKELENILSRALPAISMNQVIVEKIDQFSAQQLEETIQRICHRELRWLAFLGTFLGFWLGLVSNVVSYWVHP